MKLTQIEGSRTVGKSYLIEQSKIPSYKFPFVDYFNNFILNEDFKESNKNLNAYHFSNGFDITLLDMNSKMLANTDIIYDRGFLSNIVLGILGDRINIDDGKKYIDFLLNKNYLKNVRIIQVKSNKQIDDRNKDKWEILDYEKSEWLYDIFSMYILEQSPSFEYITYFNKKQKQDIKNFKKIIKQK